MDISDISDISIPVAAMTPHWKPIIDSIPSDQVATGDFDPDQHLQYEPPARVHTMKDLSLPENTGISPVAVSEPFRLFTTEAVHRMRAEVLSQEYVFSQLLTPIPYDLRSCVYQMRHSRS